MLIIRAALGAALAGLLLWPSNAQAVAGGFVGSVFSGATAADPSGIYWNPAALTLLGETHALLFSGISFVRSQYQRDTPNPSTGQPFPEASMSMIGPGPVVAFVTDGGTDRFRFGVGFSLPLAEGTNWQQEYAGQPSATRYYGLQSHIAQLMIEPALAYRINRYISIGAGLDIIGVTVKSSLMVDFGAKVNQVACTAVGQGAASCPADAPFGREMSVLDGHVSLGGTGWSVGAYGGVLVTPFPWLKLGAAVHTGGGRVAVPAEMDVQIPPAVAEFVRRNLPSVHLPSLRPDATIFVNSPLILTAGVGVQPRRDLEAGFDFQWIRRSEQSLLEVDIRGSTLDLLNDQVVLMQMNDAYYLGLRGAYRVLTALRVALRLGFEPSNRTELFTTPSNVDWHKLSLHAGVAWRAARWLTLNLEYGHYFLFSSRVHRSTFAPNANPTTPVEEGLDKPRPTGTYRAQGDRVGLGATLHF